MSYTSYNLGKTVIKVFCGLYETVDVFCVDRNEWKGFNR